MEWYYVWWPWLTSKRVAQVCQHQLSFLYNFPCPWVTPNPGFKVTGYLKVEYLADGARVFKCTKHSCRSLGALPKTCKKIAGRRWKFFAKSAGRCFTPLIEIKHNSVSLCWNFKAYIQIIRGRFWLQLWTLKKFSEPCVSWKYLAKMWKNSEMSSVFAAALMGLLAQAYRLCCTCLFKACL